MSTTAAERDAAADAVLAAREIGRRTGPNGFAKVFVPHLVPGEFSPLHDELNEWHLREGRRPPGAMDAFAAPRGHGKTTDGVEIPGLWHAAYCVRRYVVIASDTYSQAVQRIATITSEVENNALLRAAFPTLRPARDAQGQLVAWRDDELAFACGCRIVAVGAGKSIRGAKAGAQRPDLLLLDDLEDKASVATQEALDARLAWIQRVALGLAGPKRGISALWVGTILKRSALLNLATGAALDEGQKRPAWARPWTPHVFRAELPLSDKIATRVVNLDTCDVDPETGEWDLTTGEYVLDDNGEPIEFDVGLPMWPELSRELLAALRYKLGPLAYAAEYLSDPADLANGILAKPRPAHFLNPDDPPLARIIALPDGRIVPVVELVRAAALDPQYAIETQGSDPDLAAWVVAGQYGALTFLLDAWIGRDRHGQARRVVDAAIEWGCYAAAVESNGAQVMTADEAAQLAAIPVVAMPATEGKVERALGLAARLGDRDKVETCRVFYLPGAEKLVEYLTAFPHGRYKDPVDATVSAVELAARAAGPARDTSTGSGPVMGGAR